MKVILVHDWLTGMRGGERCLEEFIRLYPDAKIYSLIHLAGTTSQLIDDRVAKTSFLQKIPYIARIYRWLLPLYPFAIKSLKIPTDTDLIVSLSHAAAKNIDVPQGARHICFCFTPMRYIWDQMFSYFKYLTPIFLPILYLLRIWDKRCSKSVTKFVAISQFVSARIRCFYQRESSVLFPPISDIWQYQPTLENRQNFYVYVGALVPYKNVDQIISAFNQSKEMLKIIGSGPEESKLKAMANKNIEFLGKIEDSELLEIYHQAKALIFAAKEDFGLIPIESLACGLPVIAARTGALKETLANCHYSNSIDKSSAPTGVFYNFDTKNLAAEINHGVQFFKDNYQSFTNFNCVKHAEGFRVKNFRESWYKIAEEVTNA